MKKRSALVWSERAFTMANDDWALVDEAVAHLARIFRLGVDDDGPWRWRVYRANAAVHGGCAKSSKDAKAIAEGLQGEGL